MKGHGFSRQFGFWMVVLSLLCDSLWANPIWHAPLPAAADGNRELTVTSENKESSKLVSYPLDTKNVAGRRVILSADIRTNLERSSVSWLGAKLMIAGKRENSSFYSRTSLPKGVNDWQSVRFVVDVPHDLQKVWLTLGVQKCKGTVQYRNVRIEWNDDCVLDLSRFANMGYTDPVAGDSKGGWTDQGPEKDATKFVYRKKTEWAGIPF